MGVTAGWDSQELKGQALQVPRLQAPAKGDPGGKKGSRKSRMRDRPGQRLSVLSARQGQCQRRVGSGIKFCGKVRVDALGKGSLEAFESVSRYIAGT